MQFIVKPVRKNSQLPDAQSVSAVFLLAIKDKTIVVTHNKKRGWDIPGGHREEGETILEALRREAQEEAGITFKDAFPVAIIESAFPKEKYQDKKMVVYVTKDYLLNDFIPAEDVSGRDVLDINDFMDRYEGDISILKSILSLATKHNTLI